MADALNIEQLIAKYISGTISMEEKIRLDDWINASDENRHIMDEYTNGPSIYNGVRIILAMNEKRLDKNFNRQFQRLLRESETKAQQPQIGKVVRIIFKALGSVAAVVLIGFGLSLLLGMKDRLDDRSEKTKSTFQEMREIKVERATLTYSKDSVRYIDDSRPEEKLIQFGNYIITKREKRYLAIVLTEKPIFDNTNTDSVISIFSIPADSGWQVLLPDGSKMLLDPGSSISFVLHPYAHPRQQRTILLQGGALIDVVPDPTMPFVLETLRWNISALGTLLRVRDSTGEKRTSATLYHGKLFVDNGRDTITLKPRQRASLTGSSKEIKVDPDTTTLKEIPWQHSTFNFSGERLRASMKRVAAWYNYSTVRIRPGVDTVTPGILITGNVGKDLTLDEFINEVNITSRLHIKKGENRTLIVEDK